MGSKPHGLTHEISWVIMGRPTVTHGALWADPLARFQVEQDQLRCRIAPHTPPPPHRAVELCPSAVAVYHGRARCAPSRSPLGCSISPPCSAMRTPKIAAQLPPADLPTGHRRRGWIIWADAPTFSASPTITLAAPPPTMDLNMCRCCRFSKLATRRTDGDLKAIAALGTGIASSGRLQFVQSSSTRAAEAASDTPEEKGMLLAGISDVVNN
uniref:Uncharacterized protein n=1 Tax=Oryza nivara TaxID=4536 RepID=A0A0E0JC37_ORYNI